jgi:hypothetical protein
MNDVETKLAYFAEKRKEMLTLQRELANKAEVYKAELKAWAGLTDGEQFDVLSMLTAMATVLKNDK